MSNPYDVPRSEIRAVAELRPGSAVKAVSLGLVVDFVGTLVFGFLAAIVYGAMLVQAGVPVEQIAERMTTVSLLSGFGLAAILGGSLFSLLGGYVCARIAKADELRIGAVMAVLACLLGFWMGSGTYPLLENLLMVVLTFGVVMAGAALGRRRNARERMALPG